MSTDNSAGEQKHYNAQMINFEIEIWHLGFLSDVLLPVYSRCTVGIAAFSVLLAVPLGSSETERTVHPKKKTVWTFTHTQAIKEVDQFVSSSE